PNSVTILHRSFLEIQYPLRVVIRIDSSAKPRNNATACDRISKERYHKYLAFWWTTAAALCIDVLLFCSAEDRLPKDSTARSRATSGCNRVFRPGRDTIEGRAAYDTDRIRNAAVKISARLSCTDAPMAEDSPASAFRSGPISDESNDRAAIAFGHICFLHLPGDAFDRRFCGIVTGDSSRFLHFLSLLTKRTQCVPVHCLG